MKNNLITKKINKGFTLVEMLLAIAILVVLSGAILVSISNQREKARVTRMFSEVSATIPAIYMCIADGGIVQQPDLVGGNDLCEIEGSLVSGYGEWPSQSNVGGFGDYTIGGNFNDETWYLHLNGNGARICCNKNIASCEILDPGDPCSAVTP